jgi:hypothetical protein
MGHNNINPPMLPTPPFGGSDNPLVDAPPLFAR